MTNGYEIFKSLEISPKSQVNNNDRDGETISLNRKHGSVFHPTRIFGSVVNRTYSSFKYNTFKNEWKTLKLYNK